MRRLGTSVPTSHLSSEAKLHPIAALGSGVHSRKAGATTKTLPLAVGRQGHDGELRRQYCDHFRFFFKFGNQQAR